MNDLIRGKSIRLAVACAGLLAMLPTQLVAANPVIIGIGDSIGEGVQGADAAVQTQVFSYLNIINGLVGGDLTIPYINSGMFGMVGDPTDRTRQDPALIASNVAVSGATVSSLLNERPQATSESEITSEAELVLFPRQQTQIEYVEANPPTAVICWIGNNDVLSAATSFGGLNATQMTPIATFDAAYVELANRLQALNQSHGTLTILANIPNVTDIGFLVDRVATEAITGFPVALPDGHFTTIIGAFLMKLFGNDDLVNDPGFVLDPDELTQIEIRIAVFNHIIQREADRIGMPVVDINARFAEIKANPPVFFGKTLSTNILGGLFSIDGVHPSNLGHALIANEFIQTFNDAYDAGLPLLSQELLDLYYLTDPTIDKDGDGKAVGRLGVGFIETLAFIFGITGDSDDFTPN